MNKRKSGENYLVLLTVITVEKFRFFSLIYLFISFIRSISDLYVLNKVSLVVILNKTFLSSPLPTSLKSVISVTQGKDLRISNIISLVTLISL